MNSFFSYYIKDRKTKTNTKINTNIKNTKLNNQKLNEEKNKKVITMYPIYYFGIGKFVF